MKNLNRMRVQAETLGVTLRPHVKTCKSPDVILLGNDGKSCPITVSTLREAEYFADAGFTDIIYAVSMVPGKLERAKDIMKRGVDLKIIIDDANIARQIGEFGDQNDCNFNVMIEIDVDMHRAGLSPDAPEVIEIAKIIHEQQGTELAGVLTHAGESYECETKEQLIQAAENERAQIARAADNIIEAGYPCKIVSCGSTPTATYAQNLRDVTELRAGVYVFQDAFQAGRGCSTNNDIALSVLCTVISHKNNQSRIITDAGGMALSKDQSTRGTDFDCGYGIVCDIDGNIIDNLIVTGANQEHGIITTKDGSDFNFASYPIGTRLRILPNHACMTAAAYDEYNVVDNGTDVIDTWSRCNGW
ncbi:alanine racemase [Pseudemcibacter aquimaris]|uniref:alanine racemase n=1 Tax=Pseudemcibacter aquimaris TaxID=2857064 RepID=UPI002012E4A0|nr:alanine racemase [Pseudemcibacter aquimaris]WDU59892.1 alanine racemase [Pseudemcibacter aquimaris]